ncbi:ankyrin repeat-containing domain protein [Rhodotorula diobovata]|uniref:Ankyrin repeat-containing domain protein n=1 Tax=Rhodotorula diobovata TaxID=5288 RepID=A0A5C5G1F7_9BASI|nr:ankyrin repeat-containing domain protein [Rhodotorula diobovata]
MAHNIWLAAGGEGNLDRVRQLIEQGTSPNSFDDNSYSPLHAAASWAHADILRFLVQHGGDINLADSDGDTPLYVVESVPMARLVVELGGDPHHVNAEGLTPAAALQEEYPHIALYLRTLTGEPSSAPSAPSDPTAPAPSTSTPSASASASAQPNLDAPTDELMQAVRGIMERSERGDLSEQETDDLLREVVERAVGGQIEVGRAIGEQMSVEEEAAAAGGQTRARTADDLAGEQGSAKRTRDSDDVGR